MSHPPGADAPAAFTAPDDQRVADVLETGFNIPVIGQGQVAAVVTAYAQAHWGASSTVESAYSVQDAEAAKRRAVAVRFARLARGVGGVEEVRLHETLPDLELTLVMTDPDLEKELRFRGLFIDLVAGDLGAEVGTLSIFTEAEEVPGWVRDGAELT